MFGKLILDTILDKMVKKVKKQNEEDPHVETADSSVFDNFLKKAKTKSEEVEVAQDTRSREDLYRDFYKKIEETQQENEADPEVTTADSSVFEKMKQEIELLKAKVEAKEASGNSDYTNWNYDDDDDFSRYEDHANTSSNNVPPVVNTPPTPTGVPTRANMAVTNSFGGSITLRMNPDMGAPQNVVRIPDQSMLKIVEYSDKKIILNDKETRWVKVDYNGNSGWILDSYLNLG